MFSFPLGRPVLVMLVLALASGAWLLARPAPQRPTMVMWIFADDHARIFQRPGPNGEPSLEQLYEQRTGNALEIKIINLRALDTRLLSLFMSETEGAEVPDVVATEIGSVGRYFRFPADQVGLHALDDLVKERGWWDKLHPARRAIWSRDGVLFGVPMDIHPNGLLYRKDLFDEAGIDLTVPKTWEEFQDACVRYQDYWRAHGKPERKAMELSEKTAHHLVRYMLQRRMEMLPADGRVRINDPVVEDTLWRYCTFVSGPKRIGGDASPGGMNWVEDLAAGALAVYLSPDWRPAMIREAAGDRLEGKLALRPLPVWAEGDHQTTTWGGCMYGIPKKARDPAASFRLIEEMLLTDEALDARVRVNNILPSDLEALRHPRFHGPDPMLQGGGSLSGQFVALAPDVPMWNVSPFSVAAETALSLVVERHVTRVRAGELAEAELRRLMREDLGAAQAYIERFIAFAAVKPEAAPR